VFVEASQKENILAEAAAGAGNDIGNDLLIGVPEMGLAIDVINCGRDIEPFVHRREFGGGMSKWQLGRKVAKFQVPSSKTDQS